MGFFGGSFFSKSCLKASKKQQNVDNFRKILV